LKIQTPIPPSPYSPAPQICLQRGGHVALIARTVKTLEGEPGTRRSSCFPQPPSFTLTHPHPHPPSPPFPAAKAELEGLGHGGRVSIHSADVGDDQAAARAMQEVAVVHGGFIDCVVTSAGVSKPRRFEETDAAEFASVLTTNVTGTRNAVFHALPHMTRSSGGRVVFISSQAGQVGIYGFTAYSASKFALNGLAQSLGMELHTRKIKVSVCFPPDTDTPLLAEENKTKPLITKLLSDATQTVSADVVAANVVDGMEVHAPLIGVGFDGWMVATLTSGMTPQPSPLMLFVEVLTLGLWRLVGLAYVASFYHIIGRNDNNDGRGGVAKAAAKPTSGRGEKAVLSERKNN
jgi:3-dehydrosphinganine reductase